MKLRPALVLAALVGALVGAIGLTELLAHDAPAEPSTAVVSKRPAYCQQVRGEGVARAGRVAAIFVRTTVISDMEAKRHRTPECTYDLVTPEFRQGKTRRQWRQHNPVTPFPVDSIASAASRAEDGTIQVVGKTPLGEACEYGGESDNCLPSEVQAVIWIEGGYERIYVLQAFVIRLVHDEGEWRVAAWTPVAGGSPGPSTQG